MSYNICIFDLDGTLTDPKECIVACYQHALNHFGITETEENIIKHIGPPLRETLSNAYNLSADDCEVGVKKFCEYFDAHGLAKNAIYNHTKNLLQTLKSAGKTLAVATNKNTHDAKLILDFHNISEFFEAISGDERDGSLSKNGKGKIIEIAINGLEITDKSKIVMIGDRKNDILGAKDVGIDSIGVLWGYGSREELEAAGATHIAKDTNETLEIISTGR